MIMARSFSRQKIRLSNIDSATSQIAPGAGKCHAWHLYRNQREGTTAKFDFSLPPAPALGELELTISNERINLPITGKG